MRKEVIQSLSPNPGYTPFFSEPSESLDFISLEALESYTQITSVTLDPHTDDVGSLIDILRVLGNRPSLMRLNVDSDCIDEHNAPILANIDGLHELGLSNPNRAILNILPEWLGRLSKSLIALHFTVRFQTLHQNLVVYSP